MQIPYRHIEKIKINQYAVAAPLERLDAHHAALMLLPAKPRQAHWQQLPHHAELKARFQHLRTGNRERNRLTTDLPNNNSTRTVLQTIDTESGMHALLLQARELAATALEHDPKALLVQLAGFEQDAAQRLAEALLTALLTSVCPMPSFKTEQRPRAALRRIELYGLDDKPDLARLRAEIAGNHLARWLSALPANELTPTLYRKAVQALARREGWQMDFLDIRALQRRRAGAFLAVTRASAVADAGIIHLRYRPGSRGARRLALVGKGVCFDTGGVNVKTARYMNGMHEDMQGSAVALGTLLALSRLRVGFPVDCWLALAQNDIGSRAYKPSDVVQACNGTSIEVIHTDAEGRMLLADTLALASRGKPHMLIDYATLTGACIHALSTRYSGVFSNRQSLHETLIAAGRHSGERVWPFPLDEDFDEALKSDIADIKQCTLEGEADHILATRFLSRFVDKAIDWIHVDLAASHHKGGLGHVPTDTTGFGVRFSLHLLLQKAALEKAWS